LRLFSFGGYGLALVVYGAIECPPAFLTIVFGEKVRALNQSGDHSAIYRAWYAVQGT